MIILSQNPVVVIGWSKRVTGTGTRGGGGGGGL